MTKIIIESWHHFLLIQVSKIYKFQNPNWHSWFSTFNHHYDPSTSNTSFNTQKSFNNKQSGSAVISGVYYSDLLYYSEKSLNLTFGVATTARYYTLGSDGVIGLGRKYDDYNQSFVYKFCEAQNISSKSFSVKKDKFYVGRHEDFDKEGVLNCALYGKNYWACVLQSMKIQNARYEIKASGKYALKFDTGSEFSLMPFDYLLTFYHKLFNFGCVSERTYYGFYQIRCNNYATLPELVFEVGNSELKLPIENSFYKYGKYYYPSERSI